MSGLVSVVLSVFKSLFWAFIAKPILMRAVFGVLKLAASRTDNKLDDKLVGEAEKRYYSQNPE